MIDGQIRAGGVTEARVLSMLSKIPREIFVPEHRVPLAYVDDLHWFGRQGVSRFMVPPATLAKLLHLADIAPDETVLDVGATTGYASAVMAGLAASVVGLEQDAGLAGLARQNLATLGFGNAEIVTGDIAGIAHGSIDVAVVEGMLENVPEHWFSVLKDGGRLVALIRRGPIGVAHVFLRSGSSVTTRAEFSAFLPPLAGFVASQEFVF